MLEREHRAELDRLSSLLKAKHTEVRCCRLACEAELGILLPEDASSHS